MIDQFWQELLDKDDRTSPEEYPDMALITFDELRDFMARARAADLLRRHQPEIDKVVEQARSFAAEVRRHRQTGRDV